MQRAKRHRVAMVAALGLGLLAACGDAPEGVPSEGAVTMQLIAFKPETVTIGAGDTVTWRQQDPGIHTVTSGTVDQASGGVMAVPDGRFDSGEIATGATFTFTFAQPGTYRYFCSVHPATMRGEVRVR